jgi:hypothetical protein
MVGVLANHLRDFPLASPPTIRILLRLARTPTAAITFPPRLAVTPTAAILPVPDPCSSGGAAAIEQAGNIKSPPDPVLRDRLEILRMRAK